MATSLEPRHEVVTVTPAVAEELLKKNTRNRNIVETIVKDYAKAMTEGRWKFDGASIRISPDGLILDGQHRLSAILLSGVTLKMSVWYNIEDEAQNSMDTGRKRSLADALAIDGVRDPNNVSSTTSIYAAWMSGARGSMLVQPNIRPQIPQLVQFYKNNSAIIEEAVVKTRTVVKHFRVQNRLLALAWCVFSQIDYDDAELFFEALATGAGLSEDDSILRLRNILIKESSDATRNFRMAPAVVLGLIFKAWNLYRDGEPVKTLRYRPGGSTKEAFPIPR